MSGSSVTTNIIATGLVTVVRNVDDVKVAVFTNITYPTYISDSSQYYIDGSEPLNIAGIGDMPSTTGGTPTINGSWFVYNSFDFTSVTSYPTA